MFSLLTKMHSQQSVNNKTYPAWVFDGSAIPDPLGHGERAVEFLRRLRHPASTAPGRAFQLTPWQERIVRRIYGPRNPDGSRIVKQVFLLIPRGNRKTRVYHRPDCPSYNAVAEKNRVEFNSAAAAEAQHYRLAGNCH